MENKLLQIVQNAISNGVLWPQDYEAAITASHDNPKVSKYLRGLLETQDVPEIRNADIDPKTLDIISKKPQGNANPRSGGKRGVDNALESKGFNPRSEAVAESQETQRQSRLEEKEALAKEESQEEVIVEPEEDTPTNLVSGGTSRKKQREDLAEKETIRKADKEAEEKAYKEAREAEFGNTITLEDINSSPNLQRLGVLSGDRVKDGKLVRVFSRDEDVIDIDHVLTQEDIDSSPNLQSKDAVVGDLVIINKEGEREFLSRGREAQVRQFLHKWKSGTNYLDNGKLLLEALFVVPEYAKSYTTSYGYSPEVGTDRTVEEEFGEDISKLPFNERRLALKRKKERAVQLASGPMFSYDPESTGATVGAISKAVIDPINLIPAASTAKGAVLLGTAIAGIGSMADDFVYSESGEIDKTKAAVSAAAGGILSGAFVKGLNVLGDRGAKKIVRRAQIEIDKALTQGANPAKAKEILQEAGIDLNKLKAAQTRIGAKINISPTKVAQRQAEETIAKDSAVGRLTNSLVDKGLGAISTRIKALDEATFGRLRRFEFDTHKFTAEALEDAQGWIKGFSELSDSVKNNIGRLLYNEDFDAARGLMGRGLADEFDMSVVPMLRKMGDDLKESGHTFEKIGNYFPRLIKDLKGLQKSLGKEQQGLVTAANKRYATQKGVSVDKLTREEKAEVIDMLMRGQTFGLNKAGKAGFAKARTLTLSDDQMKYYASPEESLAIYLRRAVNDIETRKFMGQHGAFDEATGLLDSERSIGFYVDDAIKAGRLRPEDEADMLEMLKSRFIGGTQSPMALNATIRDLGYLGTIANPVSAVTQLGDLGTSGALNGFRNTMASLFQSKDVGLMDIYIDEVSKELSEASLKGTAKILNKAMQKSGFRALDRLGKETYINAAFKNAKKMVKSEKGLAKFKKKIGSTYGDETQALIKDLESGNITDTVKYYLFNELADVQPIALSEFPQGYLNNPNLRIMYMLKSFTLKQIDVFRRNVVQEYAKGNKKEAVKNATLLAAYLSTANTGTQYAKDLILGRDIRAEDIPDRAMWNLLSVYGINRYTTDRYISNGDWKGAVYNTIAPATPIIDSITGLGTELLKDDPKLAKLVKPVPVVGNLYYNWFLGGAEEYDERQEANRYK